MSTMAVAKKDFRDGIRSRSLIGLIILFALFTAGVVFYFTEIDPVGTAQGAPTMIRVLGSMFLPTYLFVPVVGTMVGYKAIVGERTSGSLKFLLGLPHTRREVVFGKLLGRAGIVTVAVLIGFAVGGIVLYAFTTAFDAGIFLIFTAVTVVLGVTFVSIAVAFSSTTESSSIAIGGAITLVLLFLFFWGVFMALVNYAARELSLVAPNAMSPDWIIFLRRLNPTAAYRNAIFSLIIPDQGMNAAMQNHPFYLENWFGFVILAFWLVVPIGLAYIRFERADL
jgi:ABC-2 type transport system permease protein